MPGKDLAKAQQAENEALNNLGLKRDQATTLLQDPSRMISVRTPQSYLSKLETAINEYETAVSAVIAVTEEQDIKTSYKEKLTL